ncbi:hypothetical protein H8356DRAFT_1062202 [Neocallimastix lanati (nom. inval.)]|nr:hypothetical protein H8356DRAFT_1062202 [Neocallimastix sp. JGI-2020a]
MIHFLYILIFNILTIWIVVKGKTTDDCENLNIFLNRNLSTDCCDGTSIECDNNGNFNILKLGNTELRDISNFDSFPLFPKLKRLNIGKKNLKILPKRFFEFPALERLAVYESDISEIPNDFNTKNSLIEINLEWNKLQEFPYQFSKLPNIQHLYLLQNEISGIIDLSEFKTLIQLDVASNNVSDIVSIPKQLQVLYLDNNNEIKKIPSEVVDLMDLQELGVSNTSITEIPSDLYKLSNLNKLYLSDNPQLSVKVINFGNSVISDCKLENIKVECYQFGTCSTDSVDTSSYRECTEAEINEILKTQTKSNDDNDKTKDIKNNNSRGINSMDIFLLIIVLILFFIILGLLFYFKRNNNNSNESKKKNNRYSDYDIVVTERTNKDNDSNNDSNFNSNNPNNPVIINNHKNNENNENNNSDEVEFEDSIDITQSQLSHCNHLTNNNHNFDPINNLHTYEDFASIIDDNSLSSTIPSNIIVSRTQSNLVSPITESMIFCNSNIQQQNSPLIQIHDGKPLINPSNNDISMLKEAAVPNIISRNNFIVPTQHNVISSLGTNRNHNVIVGDSIRYISKDAYAYHNSTPNTISQSTSAEGNISTLYMSSTSSSLASTSAMAGESLILQNMMPMPSLSDTAYINTNSRNSISSSTGTVKSQDSIHIQDRNSISSLSGISNPNITPRNSILSPTLTNSNSIPSLGTPSIPNLSRNTILSSPQNTMTSPNHISIPNIITRNPVMPQNNFYVLNRATSPTHRSATTFNPQFKYYYPSYIISPTGQTTIPLPYNNYNGISSSVNINNNNSNNNMNINMNINANELPPPYSDTEEHHTRYVSDLKNTKSSINK